MCLEEENQPILFVGWVGEEMGGRWRLVVRVFVYLFGRLNGRGSRCEGVYVEDVGSVVIVSGVVQICLVFVDVWSVCSAYTARFNRPIKRASLNSSRKPFTAMSLSSRGKIHLPKQIPLSFWTVR